MTDITLTDDAPSADLFYEFYKDAIPDDPVKLLKCSNRGVSFRISHLRSGMTTQWTALIDRWRKQQEDLYARGQSLSYLETIKAKAFVQLSLAGVVAMVSGAIWLSIPAAVAGIGSIVFGVNEAKNHFEKAKEAEALTDQQKIDYDAKLELAKHQLDQWQAAPAPRKSARAPAS